MAEKKKEMAVDNYFILLKNVSLSQLTPRPN